MSVMIKLKKKNLPKEPQRNNTWLKRGEVMADKVTNQNIVFTELEIIQCQLDQTQPTG